VYAPPRVDRFQWVAATQKTIVFVKDEFKSRQQRACASVSEQISHKRLPPSASVRIT